ncbi:MAG: hypothetical protein M1133_00135 [Armatimonadetes bacterium]|nr:hypothetical protein [Armatimonadota bacterium]
MREVASLEKISYAEAREWFWVRTAIWCIPAMVVSMAVHFVLLNELGIAGRAYVWLSIVSGILSVLLGVLAALISMQLPWMHTGWRFGFLLTGPACAVVGGLGAFMLGGLWIAYMRGDPLHLPSAEAMASAFQALQFAVGAAAMWGFLFGSWFALRRDRYFVEPI